VSIKEYMKSHNVSRQTIYNRIEKGLLKTVKEGNKIYIVKEFSNSQKASKSKSEKFDFSEIAEYLELIKSSNEMLKNFDYSFLRNRLSSIEKALIDFRMDINKSNEILSQKFQHFSEDISERIQNIETKIDNLENRLEKYFSSDDEYYENIKNHFDEKLLSVSENKSKLETIEDRVSQLDEKLEEILKRTDNNKKSLNIFKR
jgi:235 kDa rhoptry protein